MAIEDKIEEGTVTRDDMNALIETSLQSMRERLLRRMRPGDSNDGHDDKGHAGPARVGSRTAPRRGGGKMNDPRRTARGRRAVSHQEDITSRYSEAARFIVENRGKPITDVPVSDIDGLRRLTARLLTVDMSDREWYYDLYRRIDGGNR